MPVILAESDWPKWLGKEAATEDELLALPKPCPDDAVKIWPVGKAVGNVKNTGPQLALRIWVARPAVCWAPFRSLLMA